MTADQMARMVDRVDVHAHFVPHFYAEALRAAGHGKTDGMPAIPAWEAGEAVKTMDMLGVRTAILSISSPGVHFGDDAAARSLARRVDEEVFALRKAHPDRFGHFAALRLPDVNGAIGEAVYALDHLRANGVVLVTNHNGIYLGDPKLEPLYRELHRRSSIIFVHPTSPACSCCARLDATFPRPMLEFMFETTRSVNDLVAAGVLRRFANLRVIVPRAGAVLPAVLNRIELMSRLVHRTDGEAVPSRGEAMKLLHFDLAGAPVSNQLRALLDVADYGKLHYGSDYPFTPAMGCELLLRQIEGTDLLDIAARTRVFRTNALALFPWLHE